MTGKFEVAMDEKDILIDKLIDDKTELFKEIMKRDKKIQKLENKVRRLERK